MADKIQTGDAAPDFTLPASDGSEFKLSEHGGEWVVLYFYPKDNTPGCTKEACTFRDNHDDFVGAGARVVGVSGDSLDSHAKFVRQHDLPFVLLSDRGDALRRQYGVAKTMGVLPGRVTYVIDPEGIVRHVFNSQMRASQHIDEALATIRGA